MFFRKTLTCCLYLISYLIPDVCRFLRRLQEEQIRKDANAKPGHSRSQKVGIRPSSESQNKRKKEHQPKSPLSPRSNLFWGLWNEPFASPSFVRMALDPEEAPWHWGAPKIPPRPQRTWEFPIILKASGRTLGLFGFRIWS